MCESRLGLRRCSSFLPEPQCELFPGLSVTVCFLLEGCIVPSTFPTHTLRRVKDFPLPPPSPLCLKALPMPSFPTIVAPAESSPPNAAFTCELVPPNKSGLASI